ncbi:MAG: hypothetical protein HRT61_07790 [Ekhidna sp.]|nr:hypothetical protein [Ekhidna sp.]
MKKILAVLLISFTQASYAQDTKKDIMGVINKVFTAMKTNDSTLLNQSFVENPNFFTTYLDESGKSKLVQGDFQKFKVAIGTPKEQVWSEPIWNEKIEIDGNLASVWVDYAFYIDDQFSHCGVDAFHLIKDSGSWKIFHLVDTRRKSNCVIPEYIKP